MITLRELSNSKGGHMSDRGLQQRLPARPRKFGILRIAQSLLTHIPKFLIELGAGFAFVGQQVHLSVDEENDYLDLLF
jgi:hypothetical protein